MGVEPKNKPKLKNAVGRILNGFQKESGEILNLSKKENEIKHINENLMKIKENNKKYKEMIRKLYLIILEVYDTFQYDHEKRIELLQKIKMKIHNSDFNEINQFINEYEKDVGVKENKRSEKETLSNLLYKKQNQKAPSVVVFPELSYFSKNQNINRTQENENRNRNVNQNTNRSQENENRNRNVNQNINRSQENENRNRNQNTNRSQENENRNVNQNIEWEQNVRQNNETENRHTEPNHENNNHVNNRSMKVESNHNEFMKNVNEVFENSAPVKRNMTKKKEIYKKIENLQKIQDPNELFKQFIKSR